MYQFFNSRIHHSVRLRGFFVMNADNDILCPNCNYPGVCIEKLTLIIVKRDRILLNSLTKIFFFKIFDMVQCKIARENYITDT